MPSVKIVYCSWSYSFNNLKIILFSISNPLMWWFWMKKIIKNIDLDSGLASIDSLLSGSPSFSSNPSLSYHTLPLDEPLDPPLTPPQQQRQNQKNKQMIPCVEESFWNWSKNGIGPNIELFQIWNRPTNEIGPNSKFVQNSISSNSKLLQIWNWSRFEIGPNLKMVQNRRGSKFEIDQKFNLVKF